MAVVAITGAGQPLGPRLAVRLLGNDAVDRVIAVTTPPVAVTAERLEQRPADLAAGDLSEVLRGADAVIHLTTGVDAAESPAGRAVNVDATRNVFRAAAGAGVGKIVLLSSAMVYGAHPDNDVPLTEDSPLRANPEFPYGEQVLEAERWAARWGEEHPEVALSVLRPAVVAGRGVDHFLVRHLVETPRCLAVKGYRPPWQFTHVDDIAAALEHVAVADLPGVYNVACEGWLSFEEMLLLAHQKPLEVPEGVAFEVAERIWRTPSGGGRPGVLHYLMHPWVVSAERLCSTGWAPQHTNRQTLAELYEDHAEFLAVPRGIRVRKRDLRRAAAGVVGAALAAFAIRRVAASRRR